ncbi:non-ribosomal peptide synthetase [Carnimonas nigrificans]|uniref:non-ribosomal peptide synthetase n=1 Tax=Carnimonas nigrificans TaxID=64323 RepID=UPI00046F8327|nr:non-ribosomal peptide synthetase [Carnimonas nigrificans]
MLHPASDALSPPTTAPQPLDISNSQRGVWYGSLWSGNERIYTTGQALEIHGPIDAPLLQQAIELTLAEVAVLRARFDSDEQQRPCQFLDAFPPLALERIDLRQQKTPRAAAWQWMQQRLAREVIAAETPLAETALLQLGEQHWVWYLSTHHLQFDAYAYTLVQQRLAEHYQALQQHTTPRPCWFGKPDEVIADEQHYADSSARQRDREYWHQRLADQPVATSLAGRFAHAASSPLRHHLALSVDQQEALDNCAEQLGVAVPELLLALVVSYLMRMSGEGAPAVALPMMGRLNKAALSTPLSVVNMLPFSVAMSSEATIGEWAQQVKHELKQLRRHQRYRHEWLASELNRMPGENPLFGMQVNILPFAHSRLFAGCNTSTHHLAPGPVDDMTLSLYLGGDSGTLGIMLESNPRLYSDSETRAHLERLQQWCDQVTRHSDLPIAAQPLALPAELERIAQWNATEHPVEETDLATLFERQVAATPEAIALIAQQQQLDYRTLNARAQRLAALISQRLGNTPAPRVVGVALPRSLELEIALLAIHKSGAAYMPLPLDQPSGRWLTMAQRAKATLLISDSEHIDQLPADIDQLDISALADQLNEPGPLDHQPLPARAPHDAAYVLFTSGSTGEPKGVLVEHRAIVNRIKWMQAAYPIAPGDRVLQKTPIGFDVSVWELFWPVISGATLVMARPDGHRDPHYLATLIRDQRISTLHFVPSMLNAFLDELELTPTELPALRQMFASGEALKVDTIRRAQRLLGSQVELHNLYGPTEAAVDVTAWRCAELGQRASAPIGRPIWNTQIEILDRQQQRLPIGCVGELYIGGRNLARGYVGRDDLTAERFITALEGQRLYRSGDLAKWNEQGEIEYLGRIDHQVKLRGQRIELGEIEAVLEQHTDVGQAVVLVIDDRLIAYLVGSAPFRDEWQARLQAHLRHWLPDYMVPQVWIELDTLPTTSNGKLDKRALPAPPTTASTTRAASNAAERTLCQLFAEALERDEYGVDDDFFASGGHSLAAVQLALAIRRTTGEEASIATVFAAPTPARMAVELARTQREGALDTLLPLRRAQHPGSAPLFCFHPAGGLAWCYAGLSQSLADESEIIGVQADGLSAGSSLPATLDEMAQRYVAAIRARQPHGPYRLLGWSLGGMVAHSVAAILQSEGEQIALLALMDTYPSDVWRDLMPPDEQQALVALMRIAGVTLSEDQPLTRATVVALLEKEQHAMASLPSETLDRLVDVVINSCRLVRSAEHRTFKGDLLFFNAAAPRDMPGLVSTRWQPWVNGTIEHVDLPTDHPGMVSPAMLKKIGAHLSRWRPDDHSA